MFRVLKRNAKLALKGNWMTAVLITLTVILVVCIFSTLELVSMRLFVIEPLSSNPTMEQSVRGYGEFVRYLFTYQPVEIGITAVFALLSLLLLAPLSLGVVHWYYSLVRETQPGFSDCFYFFEKGRRYWRSVWYTVQLNLRSLLWSIPFFALPGGLLGVSVYYYNIGDGLSHGQQAAATMGISLAIALLLLAAVLFSIFVNRYMLSAYLLCEEDERSARAAIRESVRLSKGYRASFFLFRLSYFAWMLLVPFTFGLILLFLMPYMCAGEAIYARYILEKTRAERADTEERTREFNPAQDSPEPEAKTAESPARPNGLKKEPARGSQPPVPQAADTATPSNGQAAPGRVPPPWAADQTQRPAAPASTAIPWPQGEQSPAPDGPDVLNPADRPSEPGERTTTPAALRPTPEPSPEADALRPGPPSTDQAEARRNELPGPGPAPDADE